MASELEKLEAQVRDAYDSLVALGVGLIEAFVVIVVARFLHRFVRDRLVQRFDSPYLSHSGRTAIDVLSTVVVGMASATVLLALWGVTWSGIITAVSVGTLGILLGVQDVLKSLIGGIYVLLERPYSIGDRIKVRDITGRVIGIELRTTIVRSDDGHRIVAPNSIVFTDTITNFSLRRGIRTSLILTGVTGASAEVRTRIEEAVAGVAGVDGAVEVRIRGRRPKRKLAAQLRDGLVGSSGDARSASMVNESWISWLGGGEPEVQAAVMSRLRDLYPEAKVRARNLRGTEVPQQTNVAPPDEAA